LSQQRHGGAHAADDVSVGKPALGFLSGVFVIMKDRRIYKNLLR
jgi:hypothetical protein